MLLLNLALGVFGTDKLFTYSRTTVIKKRNHGHIANEEKIVARSGNAHGLPKFVEQQAGISGEEREAVTALAQCLAISPIALLLVAVRNLRFPLPAFGRPTGRLFPIHQLKSHKQRNTSEDDGEKDFEAIPLEANLVSLRSGKPL